MLSVRSRLTEENLIREVTDFDRAICPDERVVRPATITSNIFVLRYFAPTVGLRRVHSSIRHPPIGIGGYLRQIIFYRVQCRGHKVECAFRGGCGRGFR